jgi:hypothetical protein
MTTFTKLKDGSWGLRIEGSAVVGDTVTVTKKSGETSHETVGHIVWTNGEITLATIAAKAGSGERSRRRPARGEHYCRNGQDPHSGKCCTGHHLGGYDCGATCCMLD